MTNEPKAMSEIHTIREQIYEDTKGMTLKQRMAYTQNAVREMEEKHGVKFRRLNDAPARTRKVM